MRSGLYKRLLLIALLPAVAVAVAFGIGTGWESVAATRNAARATARIQAAGLAHNLVPGRDGHLVLPGRILAGSGVLEARLIDDRGNILSRSERLDLPAPPRRGTAKLLDTIGAPFIDVSDLSAQATVPKMPLRVTVLLAPERWNNAAGRSILLAAGTTGLALLVAGLLAVLLSSGLTVRLRAITRQLTRLARGEYDTRLPNYRRGELAQAANDLNRLAQILGRRSREPQDSAQDGTEDRDPSGSKTQRKANEEFLHALDHELRSPLNAICGYAKLLKTESLTPSQRENLAIVENAAQTLTQLLDDSLRRSTKGKHARHGRMKPFDLVTLVDEIVTLAAPAAYAKPIDLIADCNGWRTLPVTGDALHLRQILTNLVGNAVKYTAKGHVCLQLEVLSDKRDTLKLALRVSDTGPGIPRKQRDRVFKPRERLRATSSIPGKGLGLALSQKLATDMGGRITLDETSEGGCEFELTLALAHAEAFAAHPMPPASRMVLWEPDPVVRTALTHRLCAAGAELDLASSRDDLFSRADSGSNYDAVLLGLAPGEKLRDSEKGHSRLRVLACTLESGSGNGTPEMAPKCIGQQRMEQFLGLHRSRQATPAQSYLSPRLWRILCEDTPIDLDRLGTALRGDSMDEARSAVHRICGTTSFVHLLKSEEEARSLERILKAPQPDLGAAWKQLARLSQTLLDELRRIAPPATQRRLAGWRIMVVDDNRLNAELLARHLESHGALIEQYPDAPSALRAAGPWHACLIDVQLAEDDGVALGGRLREHFPYTLIIAQSGDTQASTREHARRTGFHDYLTKPIDLEQLPQRLLTLRKTASQPAARLQVS